MVSVGPGGPGRPGVSRRRRARLPGFAPTLGFTLFYLGLLVLIPLGGIFVKTSTADMVAVLVDGGVPPALASYKLTFGASAGAATINALFGFVVAWVLVRYPFPGAAVLDALVDLPFAMPTAVAGIALTAVYSQNGWIGRHLEPLGLKVAFTPLGVMWLSRSSACRSSSAPSSPSCRISNPSSRRLPRRSGRHAGRRSGASCCPRCCLRS